MQELFVKTISPDLKTPQCDHSSMLARQMNYAWEHHVVIPPLSECADIRTEQDAYNIQNNWTQLRLRMGDTLVGYKADQTLSSPQASATQDSTDTRPISGRLWRSHYFPSFDGITHLPMQTSTYPRIEGKLICHLSKQIDGLALSTTDMLSAIDGIAIAIEIIDCRVANGHRVRLDKISDNAGFGGFTHGAWKRRPFSQLPLDSAFNVYLNGKALHHTLSEAPFMELIHSVQWLATTLNQAGHSMQPGNVALSRACTPAIAIAPGDQIEIEMTGLAGLKVAIT